VNTRAILVLAGLFCAHAAFAETAPCDLLTKEQLTSVLGATVGGTAAIATTGCSWTTTAPPRVVVTVSLQSEKMFAAAKSSNPPNTTKAAVSGVGDDAVFTGTKGFSSLWVKKAGKFLLVRIYGLSVPEAQAKLKSLASSAVSKL
jgi:hypothetical protein